MNNWFICYHDGGAMGARKATFFSGKAGETFETTEDAERATLLTREEAERELRVVRALSSGWKLTHHSTFVEV